MQCHKGSCSRKLQCGWTTGEVRRTPRVSSRGWPTRPVSTRRPDLIDIDDVAGPSHHLQSSADNPDCLLAAADLYGPPVYRRLLHHVGRENFFILSAGWGLISADFLLPDYDITFSSQSEPWKRRTSRDRFADFVQLTQADIVDDESVYFFGGKDYLPLYRHLTHTLVARKVIYFASQNIRTHEAFEYIRYGSSGTNWHYRCAADFIEGKIAT